MDTPRTTRTDRASAALRRVLDIAASVLRGLTLLAIGSAAAVSVAWLVWLADAPPPASDEWVAHVLVLALLLAPAGVLLFVLGVLASLIRLGRVVLGSRDALSPYTAVALALRPAILIASLFAALAAVVEVPAAVLAILILVLT